MVVVPIVARPRRGGPAASRLRAASVALLGWFPYVLGGAVLELDNPIAVSGHTRCGNLGSWQLGHSESTERVSES